MHPCVRGVAISADEALRSSLMDSHGMRRVRHAEPFGILQLPLEVLARILRLSEDELFLERYYELASACSAFRLALRRSGISAVARIG